MRLVGAQGLRPTCVPHAKENCYSKEAIDRQLSWIRLLLDSFKAEQEAQTLYCQPLQLDAVVDSVLIDLQLLLDRRQVQVHRAIEPDLPAVYADTTQFWRVFNHSSGNAIKHNPPRIHITFTAEVVACHYRRSYLRCTIENRGVCIPLKLTKH